MKKIESLEKEIIRHKSLYYQGKPEISDIEYDKLEDELKLLDPENTILSIVGTSVISGEKIEHEKKMLSLSKTYKVDDLLSWANGEKVISTFKIDGSSCSLVYEKGSLSIAKTRGDGRFGENILNKALCISSIPKKLHMYKNKVEVRGEVFCTEENFIKLSIEMENRGLEKPNNQRNIVAGLLGRKENYELSEFLSFQAFEVIFEESELQTEKDKMEWLKEESFIIPDYVMCLKKSDYDEQIENAKLFMAEGDHLIDGIVFSLNDLSFHQTMGETAHHPRYKMAYKFQGEFKLAKIESISWQVSRNGYLTPVANIEETVLSGAKVTRVTLHNFGMVKQFELKKGDIIEVVRSGEVIPKFLGVSKSSSNEFVYPQECPSCSGSIVEEEIRLICKNPTCAGKIKDEILNFISKIGIDDLSGKRLEELIKHKIVTDIPSLYLIDKEKLLKLEKVKEKLATKIIKNIEKSKSVNLIQFLSALGITGGAYNKCEKVVLGGFDTIEKVVNLTVQDLISLDGFAEKSATDFVGSINEKKETINKLISLGFNFKKLEEIKDSKISGLKFCITGSLSMKRSDLQKIIKQNGGEAVSSVSSKTDYVITNDTESTSSKFVKAKELNIPIINEETFIELIGQ